MRMKHLYTLLLIFAAVIFLPAANDPPPTIASEAIEAELADALAERMASEKGIQSLTFDLFTPEIDTAFTSPDGQTAVIWLALRDSSGRILGTEPGLLLATMTDSGWQVLLPGDDSWDATMAVLPEGMLPTEQSNAPDGISSAQGATIQTLTGYYLPYAAGTAHWLEGSISHYLQVPEYGYPSCAEAYCAFAYDFTDSGHFPLLASKEGTVYASRDSCSDGNIYCTNYIVLYNAGDNAYQIYIHMANGTIPDKLTPGRFVQRGEYLGDTDDTGYSTSEHVHFMVVNNIWLSTNSDKYYWGNSIDIRFADVPINNGMPRNCLEIVRFGVVNGAAQCMGSLSDPNPIYDRYVSGNTGAYPATGTISRPAHNVTVASGSNPLMDVTAIATDDVQVKKLRFIALINGQWVEIGPVVTQLDLIEPNKYDWDINLCAAGPLNGWVAMGLRIWDYEGNVSGPHDARMIYVDGACPGQVYLPLVRR